MADPCVFYIRVGGDVVVLAIHVDDTPITGSTAKLVNEFKGRINEKFQITNLGSISWLLGLLIKRNRSMHTLYISQKSYIESIIRRFNLEDVKSLTIPIDPNTLLYKDQCPTTEEERKTMKNVPYREAIGALNWVAVGSRPDISFIVGQLAQFMENPGKIHWEAVKRVLRYLKGTKDLKLAYGKSGNRGLEAFVDADGASQEHRRAISGFVGIIDGGAISWMSKKQELVTLSTMEAEYVASTHAAKELLWLRRLIGDIFRSLRQPILLHCDNQSAISLTHSQGQFHTRTKHIDIRWHFVKFCIEDGTINIVYCPTEDMTADILTKPLSHQKVKKFSTALGLLPV